ncbi:metallophosphoesterase [Haloimpatiens sp. FM7330]|uniref:metallophosphoesterase n=1 Tax=Haloimpatiens sp. FM7330 TaxID=3298610 RepID=UPI00362D2C9E
MEKFLKIEPKGDYRIIALSDLHGGLHLVKPLIQKVNLTDNDYLIIIGDTIQKGPYNIEMLSYLQELFKRKNTYILSGNHEKYILSLLRKEKVEDFDKHINEVWHPSIIKDWIKKLHIDYKKIGNPREVQNKIKNNFKNEIKFLEELPIALEFDNFIFVHAGIEKKTDWKQSSLQSLLAFRSFLNEGHKSNKYVVVGHWPTQNYRKRSLCGDVLIDNDKKIICIDGGYGVKCCGQINALIIEKKDGEFFFSQKSQDDFKTFKVRNSYLGENKSIVKLDWQDCDFEVIKKEQEFSICKKSSTGEEFLLKNEFITEEDGDFNITTDSVSLFLNVNKGDEVKVIKEYGKFIFAKYNGEIGWIEKEHLELK